MGRSEERERRRQRERAARERRRHLRRISILFLLAALAAVIAVAAASGRRKRAETRLEKEKAIAAEEKALEDKRALIAQADVLAEGYDYDGAITLLQGEKDFDTDADLINAIAKYTAAKTNLEAKDVTQVPHIFFQSLIADPSLAFSTALTEDTRNRNNSLGTTTDEFDKIIQQLYDNDYVLVSMHDLVTETKNSDGTVTLAANNSLLLPADKKPYVLSFDDWNYPPETTGMGYAEKAVLDTSGSVKCEFTDASGQTQTGDYDVVPRLNSFFAEHPDGAYQGARGMIALTGSEGVFGYRTAGAYKTGEGLTDAQQSWLTSHPDFNYDSEVSEAKEIADAVKASGWEFAYHTYDHSAITHDDLDLAKSDYSKWKDEVGSIVGDTDTMIFVPGSDIGDWHIYDADTDPVFAYYRSQGICCYATADSSSEYWIQLFDDYIRQGRIACSGYQMWRVINGDTEYNVFENLFDVTSVFDSTRPTPVPAA